MAIVIPPYRFQGSRDALTVLLQRRAAEAAISNPLTSGAASGATITWVAGASADATLTQQYRYSAFPSAFALSGGFPLASSGSYYFASSWIYPGPGLLSAVTGFTTTASPYYYYSPNTWRVRWMTSAAIMEVHTTRYDGNTNYHVLVDGQYATPAGGLNPTSNGVIRIAFSGRAERQIEISTSLASAFNGVYMTALDDIWAPPGSTTEPLVVFDGDSFSQGGGLSSPVDPDAVWCQQMAMRMGWRNVWQTAVASTGYLSIGNPFPGSNLSTMRYRLQNGGWLSADPKVIVAAGGYNDVSWVETSSVTQAQVVAEVVLYCQAVRSAYPQALVFILGPWAGRRGPDGPSIAMDTAMNAAVAGLGDPKMFFVTVCNSIPSAWQYGTGRVGTTAGNGNSDWTTSTDATHPTNAGHAHIAARAANSVREIISSL